MSDDTRIEVAQVVTRFIAGAGGVALRGALELDTAHYHVTVVTGARSALLDQAEAAGMDTVVEPSLVAPIAPRSDATALSRLTTLFRARGFDVVHTHSAKAGALGRLAAHRAGVPLVAHTYHGFPFHDFQDPLRHAAYVGIERRLARITDEVFAIGTGVATEALRRGLARPEALHRIAPAVAVSPVVRTAETRARARALLGLDPDVPVVGTVGRIEFQKAPEHFVAAIHALARRDAHAVWIGSGPDARRTEDLVRARGLADRVHLVGERTDVDLLLPAFDVFAMASRYEGLPCAVVEAMHCGLPVVATAVNSVSDLVVPGESGLLVPPGRPELLARAIDCLLDDPARAERLAARGQALAAEGYDVAGLAGVLDAVYRRGLVRRLVASARTA